MGQYYYGVIMNAETRKVIMADYCGKLTESGKGDLAPVLNFIREYEDASWHEVSRLMVLKDIATEPVYDAYIEALRWYRDLVSA